MKKIFLLILASVTLTACSSDDDEQKIYTLNDIVGVWGTDIYTAESGSFYIEFVSDGTLRGVQKSSNNEPIIYGDYSLKDNNKLTTGVPRTSHYARIATIISLNTRQMKLSGGLVIFTDRSDMDIWGKMIVFDDLVLYKMSALPEPTQIR